MFRKALYLLTLYPGNEIIEQVCLVSGRCLEFPLASPLGKLLAGAELLLRVVQVLPQSIHLLLLTLSCMLLYFNNPRANVSFPQ